MQAFHYNYGGSYMQAQRRTAQEQYQLILECRSSGLSDYQWCMDHDIKPGTFYNWVKRLRKKACYEIPPAAGRADYKAAPRQDVVKLEVIPEDPATVLHDPEEQILTNTEIQPTIEIQTGTVCIKISNDIDPLILLQVLRSATGIQG